jgi:hypothetical protein
MNAIGFYSNKIVILSGAARGLIASGAVEGPAYPFAHPAGSVAFNHNFAPVRP